MGIRATRDGENFLDEYGDRWDIFADDGCGHWAVNHAEMDGAGEATKFVGGDIEIAKCEDGKTFGVNCQDEFIVENGQWAENEPEEDEEEDADTWVVCGQESSNEPWELVEDGFPSRDDAAEWLMASHRLANAKRMSAFYIDRAENEGAADEYYTRLPDGSLAYDNHGLLTYFAD